MKNTICLILLFMSSQSFSNDFSEDFSKNNLFVYSVSDPNPEDIQEKNLLKNEIYKKYCDKEIVIFCTNSSNIQSCLLKNKSLITGSCLDLLNENNKKGLNIFQELSIHDLKLPSDTKIYNYKNLLNFKLGSYNSPDSFYYRNIFFRKGFLKIRNYDYNDYKKQFVIFSGKPARIFSDASGISYNPAWQKGDFFFDDKGNVTVGTLASDYVYKDNIILKEGTIVAFDDNRKLIRGTLKNALRINRCGFLGGMTISEKEIKRCFDNK